MLIIGLHTLTIGDVDAIHGVTDIEREVLKNWVENGAHIFQNLQEAREQIQLDQPIEPIVDNPVVNNPVLDNPEIDNPEIDNPEDVPEEG